MVIPIAWFEMDISDFVHSSRVEYFEQMRQRLGRKQRSWYQKSSLIKGIR
jgi:hypothetical protein